RLVAFGGPGRCRRGAGRRAEVEIRPSFVDLAVVVRVGADKKIAEAVAVHVAGRGDRIAELRIYLAADDGPQGRREEGVDRYRIESVCVVHQEAYVMAAHLEARRKPPAAGVPRDQIPILQDCRPVSILESHRVLHAFRVRYEIGDSSPDDQLAG